MPQEEVKGHRALSQQQGRHRNDSKDRGVSQPGSKDRLRYVEFHNLHYILFLIWKKKVCMNFGI